MMTSTGSLSSPDSLEALSDAAHRTLIETGWLFRSSFSMQSRSRLKRTIPNAHEQYQLALDDLSERIFIAKAFLERDYEEIRKIKAAQQLPEIPLDSKPIPTAEDMIVNEVRTGADRRRQDEAPRRTNPMHTKPASDTAIAMSQLPAMKAVKKGGEESRMQEGATSGASRSFQDLNFDSMLPMTGSRENGFGLNLSLSRSNMGNQNFLPGSAFPNASTGNNQARGQGQSIRSLLPGFEGYAANAVGDNLNLGLQNISDRPPRQPGLQRYPNQQDIMIPGVSTLDDLFMEKDNTSGDANDNVLGGGRLDDFDSWFA